MKLVRAIPLIFFLLPAAISGGAETPFLGAIPVQYVAIDKDANLDMHRFLHPPGAHLEIAPNPDVDIAFDAVSLQLRAHSRKVGLADVELTARSNGQTRKTILTLAVTPAQKGQRFVYKPSGDEKAAQRVFVAGAFNGWSADKTPLTGPNEKGEYVAEVPLEPGKYGYKIVVDGKWTLDPTNPLTEDNGLGDKNSVVTVTAGKEAPDAPVIYADRLTGKTLTIRNAGGAALSNVSAIFETGSECTRLQAKVAGDNIEVTLPPGKSGFARVIAATESGNPSNVVRCAVGAAGGDFSWHDAVLYYAFTDRFADGDTNNDKPVDNPKVEPQANFHGGDLAGIRKKIEEGYFEKLGVNTIWVAPLNKNPDKAYQESPEPHRWYTGYHGYWPVSSTELDPHIGSAVDLQALVTTAHAHNQKVI
ncbi:MAG TPA: alpha-amylase family glycosyl hydrolase, partial [Chthoniobacterales bacterium]